MADREPMDFVHRRPMPRVHHPLLVWHLGLWDPVQFDPDQSHFEVGIAQAQRRARAEAYAKALKERIQAGLRLIPDPAAGIDTFRSRCEERDLWVYDFSLGAFLASIRIEYGSEYLTLTTLLDMSDPGGADCWRRCLPPVRSLFAEISAYQARIDAAIRPEGDRLAPEEQANLAEACFAGLWEAFGRDLLETEGAEFATLGKRFADFRALVIGDPAEVSQIAPWRLEEVTDGLLSAARPAGTNVEEMAKPLARFQWPHWHIENNGRPDHRSTHPPSAAHWRDRFHVLWPILAAPIRGKSLIAHEFTATIFDESALHVTAMGANPDQPKRAGQPLYYAVYTTGMGGWAIGRLVNSLCELGTLRLAATEMFPELRNASSPLREAELALQQAFDGNNANELAAGKKGRFDRRRAEKTGSDREGVKQVGSDLIRVELLQEALRRAQGFKEQADGELKGGGVAYRVERSEFYIKRFRDVLKAYRIQAYDDFQPYDKYVSMHHGSAFRYIELVGTQYARLKTDMRTLYGRLVAEEGRVRYQEIVSLQRFAEFLSLAILAPYYAGMVFSHAICNIPEDFPRNGWLAILLCCLSAAFAWPVIKDIRKRRPLHRRDLGALLAAALFTGLALWPGYIALNRYLSGKCMVPEHVRDEGAANPEAQDSAIKLRH